MNLRTLTSSGVEDGDVIQVKNHIQTTVKPIWVTLHTVVNSNQFQPVLIKLYESQMVINQVDKILMTISTVRPCVLF